jgi:hypothetical protein
VIGQLSQSSFNFFFPPLSPLHDLLTSPGILSREHECVAPDDFFNRTPDVRRLCLIHTHIMILHRVECKHELAHQAIVAASMTSTGKLRMMG